MDQHQIMMRSRQLNPYDDLFWKSRGYPERPANWQDILEDMGYYNRDTEESEEESDGESYEDEDEDDDDDEYDEDEDEDNSDEDYEEHRLSSNQKNPNNDEYWIARGYTERPDNWRELIYGY